MSHDRVESAHGPARADAREVDVAVVGAGFGGILAALRLKAAGHSFLLFERGSDIGGVWRDNVYPGCACDIRSQFYCLEGLPNRNWTSNYGTQAEILAYLKSVVRDHDLASRIRLGAEIVEARLLEAEGRWLLHEAGGRETRARVLLLATGPHSRPRIPAIPGRERFEGPSFHSAQWDADFDPAAKRVAVIGSAASAVQIIPALAGTAARLSLFQRSPNWIIPRRERRLSAFERWLFRHAPASQAIGREFTYWLMEAAGLAVLGHRAPAWVLTALARRNLRAVRDPALRARMTPDYPIGCKRILVSDDYYPAFNRLDTELVTTPIARITPHGLETSDGIEHRIDALVWATGFHVADTDGMLRIVGRDGGTLAEDWSAHGMQAFLGINVAGYPNLAILLGPNSGPPASSAVHVMESQMRYVEQYVSAVLSVPDHAMLDVRAKAQDVFNDRIQRRLGPTAWNAGCSSWYIDRRGRNTTMYPGVTSEYRRLTAHFRASDYQLRTVVPPA